MSRNQYESLYYKAVEADSCISDLMDNSVFIKQQQEMLAEIN